VVSFGRKVGQQHQVTAITFLTLNVAQAQHYLQTLQMHNQLPLAKVLLRLTLMALMLTAVADQTQVV
jgi:hypothetical protein